jgi:hypothetical protein
MCSAAAAAATAAATAVTVLHEQHKLAARYNFKVLHL